MTVLTPHFALPFRIVDGVTAVTEQDSDDEIRDCVRAIVLCPCGHRIEAPTFGAPDQTFAAVADPALVAAAVALSEPRAQLLATRSNESLVAFTSDVIAELQTEGA